MNYSALKKAHRQRTIPVLLEDDLEESFVRGKATHVNLSNSNSSFFVVLYREWAGMLSYTAVCPVVGIDVEFIS